MTATTMTKISVLIVDDHPALIAGVRTIIEKTTDIYVIGEASTGMDAEILVRELHPKIILLDLKIPGFSPSTFERWVRTNYPETVTLVLTAHDRDSYLAAMMDAGATGYLNKEIGAEQLILAIRQAAVGSFQFDAAQVSRVALYKKERESKLKKLTRRELQILKHVTQGTDNNTISNLLCITRKTVECHITNILRKLELKSRHEAITWMFTNFSEKIDIDDV